MRWLSLLATAGDLPLPAQLGIAVPFALALGFIGKWLLNRLEAESKAKDELAQQLIDKVVPALTESTVVLKDAAELLREISAEGRRRRMHDE